MLVGADSSAALVAARRAQQTLRAAVALALEGDARATRAVRDARADLERVQQARERP